LRNTEISLKILQTKFSDSALERIKDVLISGDIGFGPNVSLFESQFQAFSKTKHNIATNSASAAAFMIFSYLKETYGICDVYTPSLTFTSPTWAAKHFGHNIIFVDVNDELLFDIEDYREKRKLRSNTKAVLMPVLYGGVSTVPGFNALEEGEIVVVDAAHCPTPAIESNFTFFSFHPAKPISAPDGGIIATNIDAAAEYFKVYRNFGRVNTVDGYDIVQQGFKFYMNNLSASIALESMRDYSNNLGLRIGIYDEVKTKFKGRFIQHDTNSSYYFATLLTEEAASLSNEYKLVKHYPLLHKTEYYNNKTLLSNTERLHSKIVNLPLYDQDLYNS
jgi:dTDP-4-amino-4,6-dideoxygalactose transaminase